MSVHKYEQPAGRNRGQPEVLVCQATINQLGMPAVDYDLLTELSGRIINNPSISHPLINLHQTAEDELGYYEPYSDTINVNAISSEVKCYQSGGIISTLAHELQHYADMRNNPIQVCLESRWNIMTCASKHLVARLGSRAITSQSLASSIYENSPLEKRAREQEQYANIQPHEQAILFPYSPRTEILLANRQLTQSTITKLGLDEYLNYASDNKDYELF